MNLNILKNSSELLDTVLSLIIIRILLIALMLWLLTICLYAQPVELKFEHLTSEQGLSQNGVLCILQDSRGFMWFGTQDGLNKYDGYTVTTYYSDPADSTTLSSSWIISLCEDQSGTLWIGTYNGGVNCMDLKTEKITRYVHNPNNQNSLTGGIVWTIIEDTFGIIWIGTDYGLNAYDRAKGTFTRWIIESNDSTRMSQNSIRSIYETRSNTLWVGTLLGLNIFDRKERLFAPHARSVYNKKSCINASVNSICEDVDGLLWLGTAKGVIHFNPATGLCKSFTHTPSDSFSISDNTINEILFDSDGTVWVGTGEGGLNRFDARTQRFYSYRYNATDPNSLRNDCIDALYEDRSGTIWIGTWGGGLSRFSPRKNRFNHYHHEARNPNSLGNNFVNALCKDRSGIIWVGSLGGLYRIDREANDYRHYRHNPTRVTSLSDDNVTAILEDRFGTLWVGTYNGGLNAFDRTGETFFRYKSVPNDSTSLLGGNIFALCEDSSGALWIGGNGICRFDREKKRFIRYRHDPNNPRSLANDDVRSLYIDRSGSLWIATYGGGFDNFDEKQGRFIHYSYDPNNPKGIKNNNVNSIYEDEHHTMWIGTDGGLYRFEREIGEFKKYTTEEGLPNNFVMGLLSDDEGNLWLSTNRGLSKFDPRSGSFRNYDAGDGLQSDEFNQGAYFRSSDGDMFFGGVNGFNSFFPVDVKDNMSIPPIAITAIMKFNKPMVFDRCVSEINSVEFSYRDNFFAVEFAALHYWDPAKNQYAYMLEGFDGDWIRVGNRRYASYTNLDGGEYIFRVKGSNSDGIWNENGTKLKITIVPPFWKTWWFYISTIVTIVVSTYTWQRRRIHRKLERERLLSELKSAHDMQMGLMPKNDPVIEGFEISGICKPAQEVGGDFFDYVWLDDERTKLCIVVADVSGKAMKAAITAVMTNGMVCREIGNNQSPQKILCMLNKPMYLKTESSVFTTMVLAVVDIKAKTLTVANAGHLPPIVKCNGSLEYIQIPGMRLPLGVIKDIDYAEHTIELKAGSSIVFYSDGLTEAMNERQEEFGSERLEQTIRCLLNISAREIRDYILEDIQTFVGSAKQHDDMTLVVVNVS